MKISNKVVVVTGSTRGIGLAIAEACAEAGARVVICSRREAAVQETCDRLGAQGRQVSGIAVDVAAPGDLERLLEHAVEMWGRVDVWINNAGLSGGLRPLQDLEEHEIAGIVAVNLTATLRACRLVIPYFAAHGGGILLNMSGKGGRCEPSPYMTVYSATKAAVTNLSKSLAQENRGRPISIHAVIPGMVETGFYDHVKVSPELAERAASVPYVLKALGVPLDVVGRFFVELAAQEPGRETGKVYSLLSGPRLLRGLARLTWYRITGRIKA